MQIFFTDMPPVECKMTPWDLYLVWKFAEEKQIQAQVKVSMTKLREVHVDVSKLDLKRSFTSEALSQFEDNYAERGILIW